MDTLLVKWRDYQPHLDQFSAYLSPTEQDRAQRFAHEADRTRYIIARGLLYQGCAERLNVMPKDIEFALGQQGKPYVVDHDLHINLSHSVDWLLLGFDQHHPIGVDIQHHDDHDYIKLAQRFFHPEEQAQLAVCSRIVLCHLDPKRSAGQSQWTRHSVWLNQLFRSHPTGRV